MQWSLAQSGQLPCGLESTLMNGSLAAAATRLIMSNCIIPQAYQYRFKVTKSPIVVSRTQILRNCTFSPISQYPRVDICSLLQTILRLIIIFLSLLAAVAMTLSYMLLMEFPVPGTVITYTDQESPGTILDSVYGDHEFKDDNLGSLGRIWDGAARPGKFGRTTQHPPETPGAANNDVAVTKLFDGAADAISGDPIICLTWRNIGRVPAVWDYSPKQNDYHSINIEGFAYKPPTSTSAEMIIGLRSPLTGRTTGNAVYFRVTDITQFLPTVPPGWNGDPPQPASGLSSGLEQLDLNGQGIRAITWYAAESTYLIIGGPANGGPLEKEIFGQKYSLYSWDGSAGQAAQYGHVATPLKIIDDLRPYTVRPEGLTFMTINGEARLLFVEDRYRATGYATRNMVHWPVSILGTTFQSQP